MYINFENKLMGNVYKHQLQQADFDYQDMRDFIDVILRSNAAYVKEGTFDYV